VSINVFWYARKDGLGPAKPEGVYVSTCIAIAVSTIEVGVYWMLSATLDI
jgi:hypothetical protein